MESVPLQISQNNVYFKDKNYHNLETLPGYLSDLTTARQNVVNTDDNTTSPYPDDDRDQRIAVIEVAVSATILFLAVVGNGCVLISLYMRKSRRWSRMLLMILHLSLADLFVAFFNVLPQLAWDITYRFLGGGFLCKAVKYFQLVAMYASAYVLLATATDRYLAICHPFLSHKWTPQHAHLMVGLAWVASLVLSLPQIFIFSFREIQDGVYDCWGHFDPLWTMTAYITWITVSIFVVPTCVLACLYGKISLVVWRAGRLDPENITRGTVASSENIANHSPTLVGSTSVAATAKVNSNKEAFNTTVAATKTSTVTVASTTNTGFCDKAEEKYSKPFSSKGERSLSVRILGDEKSRNAVTSHTGSNCNCVRDGLEMAGCPESSHYSPLNRNTDPPDVQISGLDGCTDSVSGFCVCKVGSECNDDGGDGGVGRREDGTGAIIGNTAGCVAESAKDNTPQSIRPPTILNKDESPYFSKIQSTSVPCLAESVQGQDEHGVSHNESPTLLHTERKLSDSQTTNQNNINPSPCDSINSSQTSFFDAKDVLRDDNLDQTIRSVKKDCFIDPVPKSFEKSPTMDIIPSVDCASRYYSSGCDSTEEDDENGVYAKTVDSDCSLEYSGGATLNQKVKKLQISDMEKNEIDYPKITRNNRNCQKYGYNKYCIFRFNGEKMKWISKLFGRRGESDKENKGCIDRDDAQSAMLECHQKVKDRHSENVQRPSFGSGYLPSTCTHVHNKNAHQHHRYCYRKQQNCENPKPLSYSVDCSARPVPSKEEKILMIRSSSKRNCFFSRNRHDMMDQQSCIDRTNLQRNTLQEQHQQRGHPINQQQLRPGEPEVRRQRQQRHSCETKPIVIPTQHHVTASYVNNVNTSTTDDCKYYQPLHLDFTGQLDTVDDQQEQQQQKQKLPQHHRHPGHKTSSPCRESCIKQSRISSNKFTKQPQTIFNMFQSRRKQQKQRQQPDNTKHKTSQTQYTLLHSSTKSNSTIPRLRADTKSLALSSPTSFSSSQSSSPSSQSSRNSSPSSLYSTAPHFPLKTESNNASKDLDSSPSPDSRSRSGSILKSVNWGDTGGDSMTTESYAAMNGDPIILKNEQEKTPVSTHSVCQNTAATTVRTERIKNSSTTTKFPSKDRVHYNDCSITTITATANKPNNNNNNCHTATSFGTTAGSSRSKRCKNPGISRAKLKTIKLTLTVVICYVICWLPFFAGQMWTVFDENAPYQSPLFSIIMLLASVNSCTNPWIYMVFSNTICRHARNCMVFAAPSQFTSHAPTDTFANKMKIVKKQKERN